MIDRKHAQEGQARSCPTEGQARIAQVALFLGARGSAVLHHLIEAAEFARELGRDVWDFAVEIQTFRDFGLTNNDFRWLVCNGLAEHKQEITAAGDAQRVFQPDRPLSFCESTCFVLGQEMLALAANGALPATIADGTATALPVAAHHGNGGRLLPKWDRDRQELRLGGIVVKQFKVPAVNQERILAAFEEEGWPVHIDDPLPPHPLQDPKRRLHDTIISLNRNQKNPLIYFRGNGNGQGIRWDLAPKGRPRRKRLVGG